MPDWPNLSSTSARNCTRRHGKPISSRTSCEAERSEIMFVHSSLGVYDNKFTVTYASPGVLCPALMEIQARSAQTEMPGQKETQRMGSVRPFRERTSQAYTINAPTHFATKLVLRNMNKFFCLGPAIDRMVRLGFSKPIFAETIVPQGRSTDETSFITGNACV